MARQARGKSMDPTKVQVFHITQRCVRRAFLCGDDAVSGKSYEHRKQWIRDRLEFLASIFGVDVLTYTVMSNHIHHVLRSRPDVVADWNDQEVVDRYWRLHPQRKNKDGSAADPTEAELNIWLNDAVKLQLLRRRLSDISWFMSRLSQTIALKANYEDKCSGRFWEGRFKSQALLDEASILACAMYVDLNPIRAAMAETPETSSFTGAKDRLDDLQSANSSPVTSLDREQTHAWERSGRGAKSGWMSPVEIDEAGDPIGPDKLLAEDARRASSKGFLNLSLHFYLDLLDWTGRNLASGKRGAIPDHLDPILKRVGIVSSGWCDLIEQFGRLFKRAVGSPQSLADEAEARGQKYLQAPGATTFVSG